MPLYVQRIATVYIRDSKARKGITGHLCMVWWFCFFFFKLVGALL